MSEGTITRKPMRFEREFVQLPNAWMRDERLSFRSRGILALITSHKVGFTLTLRALAAVTPSEGVDAIRASVNQLEELGYLVRSMTSGRHVIGTVTSWEIRDPFDSGQTTLDKPTPKNHRVGSSNGVASDHPTPVRTPSKNTIKAPSEVTPVAHEPEAVTSKANIDGFADPRTGEIFEPLDLCPGRPVAPCSLDLHGVCIDIRRHPKQGANA